MGELEINILRAVTVITATVIDKYQNGVLSTIYHSPTYAISDCLNIDFVRRRFVASSFLLVAVVVYNW